MNLQELFERQHRRVYRIAMMMLGNASDAEDAVQNIFMKYIEKGIEFTDVEHEKAWFITVTKNYCKDQLKTYWNRQVDMGEIPETPMPEEEEEGELIEQIKKLSTIQTQLAAARKKLKKFIEKEGAQ